MGVAAGWELSRVLFGLILSVTLVASDRMALLAPGVSGKDVDAELRRVLDTAYPGEEARYFLPMSIGSAPEHADAGAALILSGVKTLTSSPFWDYPDSDSGLG
jgi:hypothetical protein